MSAISFNLAPPTRQTLADSIAQSLREAIFGGQLGSGQRLAEGQLAGSLKVSRAPVREALACLEQEGLVSRTPSGGTTVTHLSRTDAEEICSLRSPLEMLAVRLAIARGSDANWKELAENIRVTEEVADPQQLDQLDLEFHEKLVRAARHGRLLSSWLNLRSQIRLIMAQRHLGEADPRSATVRDHQELLGAMRAKDTKRAMTVLEHQLESYNAWIISVFGDEDDAKKDASKSENKRR